MSTTTSNRPVGVFESVNIVLMGLRAMFIPGATMSSSYSEDTVRKVRNERQRALAALAAEWRALRRPSASCERAAESMRSCGVKWRVVLHIAHASDPCAHARPCARPRAVLPPDAPALTLTARGVAGWRPQLQLKIKATPLLLSFLNYLLIPALRVLALALRALPAGLQGTIKRYVPILNVIAPHNGLQVGALFPLDAVLTRLDGRTFSWVELLAAMSEASSSADTVAQSPSSLIVINCGSYTCARGAGGELERTAARRFDRARARA
jgi:hypothetical protein